MTYQPMDNKIIFQQHYPDGMEEIIRLDKEGFHYRDQFIADAGEAHRLMVEFLRQNTQPEPQGPCRPAIEPVPVAERLPGPGDRDGKGWCWWFDGFNWILDACVVSHYTHWLPHHALPVPQQETDK